MKYLSIISNSIVVVAALLLAGCDSNSVLQQDNTPPS
jgi:outer membrane murein-binding lipoprotein Lpp